MELEHIIPHFDYCVISLIGVLQAVALLPALRRC